jgi:hypothetical protein
MSLAIWKKINFKVLKWLTPDNMSLGSLRMKGVSEEFNEVWNANKVQNKGG